MLPSTERFTSRVDDYVRYRPSYPHGVIETLVQECDLHPGAKVADIGAGTGIFSKLLLDAGANVEAVEPNDAMRQAADRELGENIRYRSVKGTAEATSLATGSIDLLTAAQAFHWFVPELAKQEFQRILKPSGYVALIWNERLSDGSDFLCAYEQLLRTQTEEYLQVRHREPDSSKVAAFFEPNACQTRTFDNSQSLDWQALLGRVMSSSYAPQAGHQNHLPFVKELERIYDSFHVDGRVELLYQTRIYFGKLP